MITLLLAFRKKGIFCRTVLFTLNILYIKNHVWRGQKIWIVRNYISIPWLVKLKPTSRDSNIPPSRITGKKSLIGIPERSSLLYTFGRSFLSNFSPLRAANLLICLLLSLPAFPRFPYFCSARYWSQRRAPDRSILFLSLGYAIYRVLLPFLFTPTK